MTNEKVILSDRKQRSFLISIFLYMTLIYQSVQAVLYLLQFLGIYLVAFTQNIINVGAVVLGLLCIVQAVSLYGILQWRKWGAYVLVISSSVYTGMYLHYSGSIGYSIWLNVMMTSIFWSVIISILWKNLE